ncbi:hypothetical protein MMC20_003721 [Loxospora ochrophaea]|nr:hypothetical protein [Loxospora ochrophaea]
MDQAPVNVNQNRGSNVVVLTSVFTALSFLTTALRLVIRKLNRQLSYDDLAITIAVLFTLVSWPFTILAVGSGYGRHQTTLTPAQIENVLHWLWVIEFNLFFTLPLTKISICCFMLRIKNKGWLKWCLYAMMIGLVLTSLPALIVLCAQCQPLRAYWDRSAGTCWNANVYNIAIWIGVSFNIFSDLACTCFPVIVLWNVKIKTRTKYLISALMSLGLIATSCGGVRAYISAVNNDSKDLTYALAIITEWAVRVSSSHRQLCEKLTRGSLEQHFAILGTNFALSRYVYKFLRDIKGSTNHSTATAGTIALSNRRKYTFINESSTNAELSLDTIAPLDPAVIRATTEIDIRPSSPSKSPMDFDARIP